jgi:hypothetical protein
MDRSSHLEILKDTATRLFEYFLEQFFTAQMMMFGEVAQYGAQCPYPDGVVGGNGDVVFAVAPGGQADMAPGPWVIL